MSEPRLLDPTAETWALELPGHVTRDAAAELLAQLKEALPGKRVVIVKDGARFRPLESLDAAWAEAESALPEGWAIDRLTRVWDAVSPVNHWRAWANRGDGSMLSAWGQSPTAALLALAAQLRDVPR